MRPVPRSLAAVAACALVALAPLSARAQSRSPRKTFVVATAADAGPGSLRQAIADANASPGEDTVAFALEPSGRTIRPRSPLPAITGAVTIDGATQPGYDGVPLVEIDGSAAGAEDDGLVVSGDGHATIRALVVNGFAGGAGVVLGGDGSSRVLGCYVGTSADGSSARPNDFGIRIVSSNNVVGGSGEHEGNVVSGNAEDGITVGDDETPGVSDNSVLGNRVGTDATGTRAVGNGSGISVRSQPARIGGHEPGEGNLVSGNGYGISVYEIADDAFDHDAAVVEGNLVGTDASGAAPLGNSGTGVAITHAPGLVLGGREPGAGNVIAYNGEYGVFVRDSYFEFLSNAVYANADAAVYNLTSGQFAEAPTVTSVTATADEVRVRGGFASSIYSDVPQLVQFFASDACEDVDSPELKRFLGQVEVTPNDVFRAYFDVSFPGTLAPDESVTVTTTNFYYTETSRFARCSFASNCEAPFVERVPNDVNVRSGQRATLTAEAHGSAPLRVQWYITPYGTDDYRPIQGATSLTVTTPPLTTSSYLTIKVENACGESSFGVAVAVCSGPPVVETQPKDLSVGRGAVGQLYVGVPFPTNPTYQWYEGESGDTSRPVEGAVYAGLNLTGDATKPSASYWVRITNSCGSVDSAAALVVVAPIISDVELVSAGSGKSKLVITGTGFADLVDVVIGGVVVAGSPFATDGTRVIVTGKLTNGASIKRSLPRGRPTNVTLGNRGGAIDTYVFTRR